jgi:hypothetical protein
MLAAYNVSLLGDEEATATAQPQAGEPILGKDINCDAQTNVCTPTSEVTKVQIMSLQSALNRAATFFDIDVTPVEADGIIGPATMTAAIKIANIVGADAHPVFAEIAAVDPMDKASVFALAQRLATAPISIQNAFDEVTGTAREATVQEKIAHAKRTKIYWAIGLMLIAGLAAGGAVYYVRKQPELAPA